MKHRNLHEEFKFCTIRYSDCEMRPFGMKYSLKRQRMSLGGQHNQSRNLRYHQSTIATCECVKEIGG